MIAIGPEREAELQKEGVISYFMQNLKGPIERTLYLEKDWDLLDRLLRRLGTPSLRDVLSDAVLGRTGQRFGTDLDYGPAKKLSAARVKAIARALEGVSSEGLAATLSELVGEGVYAYLPPGLPAKERAELLEEEETRIRARIAQLKAFYESAAARGEGVIAAVA